MPPKAKYTKKEVAAVALEMIRTDGLDALTARELGKRLGMSVSPIFTMFRNMEEVKQCARELAMAEFREYISDYREFSPAFKRIGMMIVSYGIHQPELFKLLFMQEHREPRDFSESIRDLGEIPATCVELICRDYGMTREEAWLLFEQLWTHAFGLGAMCAMKVCNFSEEEIGRRLGLVFAGMVTLVTSGCLPEVASNVEKHTNGTFHGRPVGELPYGMRKQRRTDE